VPSALLAAMANRFLAFQDGVINSVGPINAFQGRVRSTTRTRREALIYLIHEIVAPSKFRLGRWQRFSSRSDSSIWMTKVVMINVDYEIKMLLNWSFVFGISPLEIWIGELVGFRSTDSQNNNKFQS
jgi:hypothetical protein